MVDAVQIKQLEGAYIVEEEIAFEEYLKRYDGVRAEWLGGKVIVYKVSNNTQHQGILGLLYSLFDFFLGLYNLGKPILAGVPMKVDDERPAREPDLMILLNEHLDRLQSTYVIAPADICIEIVSPESDDRDRGTKFLEYEYAKVPEYWLLDPLRTEINVYSLGEDGRYHRREFDEQGRATSAVLPGFKLDPEILWQTQLPRGHQIAALVEQMKA